MRKIFLILFINVFTNLFCQNSDYEKVKSEFEQFIFSADSTKIQNIKTEKFENIFEIKQFNQTVSRDVEFGLRELIFNITFVYRSENTLKYPQAEIHHFYYNEKTIGNLIIYAGKDKLSSRKFRSEFQIYLNSHNDFYKTNFSLTDYINDLTNKQTYGDYCGYEMTRVKKIDGIKLRNPENAEKYVEWMKSFNLEKQMWGYDQIQYLLKNNLIELEPEEEKIYNHIQQRNAIIETCSGCTFGIFERVFKNK